jgi:hypothetical protein
MLVSVTGSFNCDDELLSLIDNTGGEDDDCDDRPSLPTAGRDDVFGFKDDNGCDDDDLSSSIFDASDEGKTFPIFSLAFARSFPMYIFEKK